MKYKSTLAADELLKLQEGRPEKRLRTSSTLTTFTEEDSATISPTYSDAEMTSDTNDIEEQLSEDESDNPLRAFEDQGRVNVSRTREFKAKGDMGPACREKTACSFAEMGVAPPLHAALARMSIRVPTEIQAACIPPLLAGLSVFMHIFAETMTYF